MGQDFDPYHKWLGIPREERPPNHYRLLGIPVFESDPDVIDTGAEKQTVYLRTCATGAHVKDSQRLLNEVSAARLCLLNPQKKAAYDAELKAKPQTPAPPIPRAPAQSDSATAPAKVAVPTAAPDPPASGAAVGSLDAASPSSARDPAAGGPKKVVSDKNVAIRRSGEPGRKKSRGNGPLRAILVGGWFALLAVLGLVGGLIVFRGLDRHEPTSGTTSTSDEPTVAANGGREERTKTEAPTRAPSVVERPPRESTGPEVAPVPSIPTEPAKTSPPRTDGGAPSPAVAPFDAAQARAHQEAWAKHLGETIEVANSLGMKLVLIPPGRFLMGSPESEKDRDDNESLHVEELPRPLLMGTCEVTQQEFEKVMGRNPSSYGADGKKADLTAGFDIGRLPVETVSWRDAVAFCNALSRAEGRVEVYGAKGSIVAAGGYRLPTEAEWEFACRAGTTSAYSFGDDSSELQDHGWNNRSAKGRPHPVGTKKPNAFGLYDMHGNVWEWCQDIYSANPSEHPSSGPRCLRGGGFFTYFHLRNDCRSAYRGRANPEWNPVFIGFRIVRTFSDVKLPSATNAETSARTGRGWIPAADAAIHTEPQDSARVAPAGYHLTDALTVLPGSH